MKRQEKIIFWVKARRIGEEEWRDAIMLPDYFGYQQHAVRFRGSLGLIHGDDVEIGKIIRKAIAR